MHPESAESTRYYEVLAWLELNKKRVIAGAAALFLLIVAFYIYDWHRDQTAINADKALLALRPYLDSGERHEAAAPAALLKVAREYPATSAAERATLLAAGDLYSDGKYAEARTQFERFQAQSGSSPLTPIAALGVATCLDAENKMDAALSAYQRVINQFAGEPVAAHARLNMALIYEDKQQPAQALRLYDELNKPAVFGELAREAMSRRDRLLRLHPELAPTNTPARALVPVTSPSTASPTNPPASSPGTNTTRAATAVPPSPPKK